jgi:hypothetical protein
MRHIKTRITWIVFYILAVLVVGLNTKVKHGYFQNLINEIKTILKHKNKYIDGGDLRLIHKDKINENL